MCYLLQTDEMANGQVANTHLISLTLSSRRSETLIFQCIRGWETEDNRYDATVENVKRIIAFRQKARCTELLSEPSEDVDFFLEHWGSEIYGEDVHGHYFWLEQVTTIHAPEVSKTTGMKPKPGDVIFFFPISAQF